MPDRLSALDATFLHLERPREHMHIGAVATFAGPPPSHPELLAHVESRLRLVPRYRQRLARAPFDLLRPMWVDHPGFLLAHHVRHTALRSPGGREQLLELAGHAFSAQLDREHPLWELWFVEGLADGGFALIFKSHHALIDGLAGVRLAGAVLDAQPAGAQPAAPLEPSPAPGPRELVALGLADAARTGMRVARAAVEAARRPEETLGLVRDAAGAIGELARELASPAPATPLGVATGPDRRLATVSCRLEAVRRDDATVNDVLLSAVAGALRRFLAARGVAVDGLVLRALVPVARRAEPPGRVVLGNEVSAVRAPLPVGIADPLERLAAVRSSMSRVKASGQARGAETLIAAGELLPVPLLAWAAGLPLATRLFNVVVTNVPGPASPLRLLGREMREAHPVAPLPHAQALAVAILSYNGTLGVGLLADPAALPELDALAGWLEEEIAALAG
jgi:diacylglycerol O-acyltransferase / wax synthase